MDIEIPEDFFYTPDHEWLHIENGNLAVLGISDFAQQSLGDITFVELPREGQELNKDEVFGVVESVKAVSDLYAPTSGKVAEVNTVLSDTPEIINDDPYSAGWIVKLDIADPKAAVEGLMDGAAYKKHVEEKG